MNHIVSLIFTGIIVGDVFLLRETSDFLIGLLLIFYALVYKFVKNSGVIAIEVSIGSIIFMYISFLRYQHGPMTERFSVWTVIFILASLVTQCRGFIRSQKRNFRRKS